MNRLQKIDKRPIVLSIAGFDPSGGAGILADIKTFEALSCYGLAVQTANTIQTDEEMRACYWTPFSTIKEQLEVVLSRFDIRVAKIGIVESGSVLEEIIKLLKQTNPEMKIILDPILFSSTNFDFHTEGNFKNDFSKVFDSIYLLTPNALELEKLYQNKSREEIIKLIAEKTNLLLKGGHIEEKKGMDTLFLKGGGVVNILPHEKCCTEKHGSGCVLSASIVAFLAKGCDLQLACKQAKIYVEEFLSSNSSLLGVHKI